MKDKCKGCKYYKQTSKYKGKCIISRTENTIKRGCDYACTKYKAGTYKGEDAREEKLKKIMKTIADNYKGGRWG